MKLEVGMYVRTDNGIIGKIYEKIGDMFTYKDSNRDYITYCLLHTEIKKASHNIIDLIEVGDYVNGYKITDIDCYEYETELFYDTGDFINSFVEEQIKSIITKEQMEQMAYKVVSE